MRAYVRITNRVPRGFLNDTMGRYRRPQAETAWDLLMGFMQPVRSGGFPADRVQWVWESDISTDYDFSKKRAHGIAALPLDLARRPQRLAVVVTTSFAICHGVLPQWAVG